MPSLRPCKSPFFAFLAAFIAMLFVFSPGASAQQPSCTPNSTASAVHAEGLAERIGDITITCTGGTVGNLASLTLFVTLNTNITNRLDADGLPTGITVTGASGSVHASSAATLNFSPLNYTISASPVVITVSGIRAAVALLAPGASVTASILGVGATFPSPSGFSLIVTGSSSPTLLSSTISNGVPCNGSPLPATLDFSGFAATSTSSTVRITEAVATAFTAAEAGADSGLRIRVSLTGYGTGTRVFVPDAIVGNSGTTPTSSGGFASTVSQGNYTPGSGQLLLARVNGADSSGVGGTLALQKPVIATTFPGVTEVSLANGSASVVYEVLDSNAGLVESAQIPVFVVVNATSCPGTLTPQLAVSVAPVSTVSIATDNKNDSVPRFIAAAPGLDCQQTGDCTSSYYPKLVVDQTAINLAGSSKGGTQSALIRVSNMGGGILSFTTSIAYQSGANWLSLSPSSGSNNVSIQAIADPASLAPGTYSATVTVSAGLYGSGTIPVTFTVGAVGVVVQNVGNAASFQYGTVAPGSYAVLYGLNLAGNDVSVTFNGLPATLVYKSASQINLIVPAALGAQQGASVVATVDGLASAAFHVNLVLNAPGIFTPGIVNFADGSVNDANHPAARGTFVTVYFTGLTIPLTGPVTVNIGSQTNLIPAFAGAQPTLPALDQVNITVPSSLPSGTSPVPFQVCIPGSTGQQVCSNSVNLYIQ
jgi:uncharacterized protein (TIGR03437 family)